MPSNCTQMNKYVSSYKHLLDRLFYAVERKLELSFFSAILPPVGILFKVHSSTFFKCQILQTTCLA